MPRDLKELLTITEYRSVCQLLLYCHSLMFESQLQSLMEISQKGVNRLTHKLQACGLIKIHKHGKANVIALNRTTAQHLLGLDSPPWLPDPNSTTALWNGAYAADYWGRFGICLVAAPQYREMVERSLQVWFDQTTAQVKAKYEKEMAWYNGVHQYSQKFIDQQEAILQYFETMLVKANSSRRKQLAAEIEAEKNKFFQRTTSSSLINIANEQQKVWQELTSLINGGVSSLKEWLQGNREEAPIEPQLELPTLPSVQFPGGARNLPYYQVSSAETPSTETNQSSLENRQTLFVELPQDVATTQWPGVSTADKPNEWTFVTLDRDYTAGWYKRLFLQIALQNGIKKKGGVLCAPKQKITFSMRVVTASEERKNLLEEKLIKLWNDNIDMMNQRSANPYFAMVTKHGWGIKDFVVANLDTGRLFRNSVQSISPDWDEDPFLNSQKLPTSIISMTK